MTIDNKIQSGWIEPGGGEKAFVISVLLLSLGAFANLQVTGSIESQNMGMAGMQALWAFLYVITIIFYLRYCARPLRTFFFGTGPLVCLLAFAVVSTMWSQDPALTVRRSVALIMTLTFGVYLASRFRLKDQFRLLALAFAICIAFSFFFELLGLNPDQGIPGWYGIFYHKTEMGRNMVLSALVFLFWKRIEPARKGLAKVGFFASVLLVVLARDMTSLIILVLLLVLLPYLQWTLRKNMAWAISGIAFLFVSGTASVLYVATHLAEITGFLGKDPMLTGRVPLWIISVVMALRRPWLGYGFNAFWIPDSRTTQQIWHLLRWMPPHAHNGLLEIWLELGLIGIGIFLLSFAYYLTKALSFLRTSYEPGTAWPLAFLIFLFLANLTESAFLTTNSIYSFLFVGAAVLCAKESKARETIGLAAVQGYA